MIMIQRWSRWRRMLLAISSAPLMLLAVSLYVASVTHARRYADVESIPPAPVAIVFGAGVRPDGRLSRMLAERVDAAVELYRAGRVEKLLMTGDNSSVNYDEVSAMRRYAIARGVDSGDITLDHAGFSTYESCYRARPIFGVERAVLVTQRYHLPRAVYTCRQLGVDAVGLGTPDWGSYHPALLARYTLREIAATARAVWQVHVTRPQPTFLGSFEGL